MRILAIETSCDETAAAIVEDGVKILSNVVASSAAMHEKYGGIVPEVAARKQLESIIPVITEALDEAKLTYQSIEALAVTIGPGLIGSLLVGVETAKTIAFATGKPIIPVNHVIAHMYANMVIPSERSESRNPSQSKLLKEIPRKTRDDIFPAISLVVSGGHTELYLMRSMKDLTWLGGTLDDAAGEAFDKAARLLGFGSRGGIAIQEHAKKSDFVHLPRPLMHDGTLKFSFSGLKTAILREWNKQKDHSENIVSAFAYEVQEAITDVLTNKTLLAAQKYHAKSILLSGGVAANLRLREKLPQAIVPPPKLCTDNAVYIASYAFFRGKPIDWHFVTAVPDLSVETM